MSTHPPAYCRLAALVENTAREWTESTGVDRGSANALASYLVPVPRARIHAEIRRAGAFGQRGGARLLRNTRGGAMPLVRGPQPPKRIVAGRSRTSAPARCDAAQPIEACGRVARAPHLADGHHDERAGAVRRVYEMMMEHGWLLTISR